jgi:ribonuclease HII
MRRAVLALDLFPAGVWVDGPIRPDLPCAAVAVVGGDRLVPAISAASILAKVARDAEMIELDACYPGYGLVRHKGYPTLAHRAALKRLGPSPIHRRSFAPVANALRAALPAGPRRG